MTEPNADGTLDCSGLNCPIPILRTKRTMDEMASGQVLKMISTDSGSCNDVAAWSRRTGNELLSSTSNGGEHVFYLRKK